MLKLSDVCVNRRPFANTFIIAKGVKSNAVNYCVVLVTVHYTHYLHFKGLFANMSALT